MAHKYIDYKLEATAPKKPAGGRVRQYADADGVLHTIQDDGTDAAMGGGSFNGGTITDPLTIEDAGTNGLRVKLADDEDSGVKAEVVDNDGVVDAAVRVLGKNGGTGQISVSGQTENGESATLNDYGGLALFTADGRKGIEAWDGPGNVLRFGLLPTAGQVVIGVTTVPPDGDLSAGQVALWFDDTDGTAKLRIKGKSANGTVVTGAVNLT